MTPNRTDADIAIPAEHEIERRLAEVRELSSQGFADQSLILGFAVLEAMTRVAFGARLSKPQTPGSVVELLAFEGFISPSQADHLRTLIKKRNRLVHGDLDVRVAVSDIDEFIKSVQGIWHLAMNPVAETA